MNVIKIVFSSLLNRIKKTNDNDENNSLVMAPEELAIKVCGKLIWGFKPFDNETWLPREDVVIVDEILNTAQIISMAFALHVYLTLISSKFGYEVEEIVKKYLFHEMKQISLGRYQHCRDKQLIINVTLVQEAFIMIDCLLELDTSCQNRLEILTVDTHEVKIANYLLSCLPGSPYHLPKDHELRATKVTLDQMNKRFHPLASFMMYQCLIKIKKETIAEFLPFLDCVIISRDNSSYFQQECHGQ